MVFVVASFSLIKNGDSLFLGESLMAFSLTLILAVSAFIAIFIFYIECWVIDDLESKWKNYKDNLLKSVGRKTGIYKVALSFRPVILKTTYPFCNVNRSTFLEFVNEGVDILVNLLVSF